uniref:Uncharacterized protein n=1 Tax=Romanomermis culicivorax TaxID=13658 RepID=A0A915LAM4_ROMCU
CFVCRCRAKLAELEKEVSHVSHSNELQKASVIDQQQDEGCRRKSDENNNDNRRRRHNSSPFVDIHERLSWVIKTFETMCARYVFFSCDEVLDPVSSLVKSIKNLQSSDEERDAMELIDQAKVLVEAFQSAIAKW